MLVQKIINDAQSEDIVIIYKLHKAQYSQNSEYLGQNY